MNHDEKLVCANRLLQLFTPHATISLHSGYYRISWLNAHGETDNREWSAISNSIYCLSWIGQPPWTQTTCDACARLIQWLCNPVGLLYVPWWERACALNLGLPLACLELAKEANAACEAV